MSPSHPVLQAHIEAVHADWKEYLNLLICEESHLKFMEDFHKVPHPWRQGCWVGGNPRIQNSCYSGNWVEEMEYSKTRIFKARRAP